MDNYPNTQSSLFSKRNIITYLLLAIIALAIPVGIRLVQTQQLLKSKAATGNEVTFPDLKQDSTGNYVTTDPQKVNIKLESPLGPPANKI